MSKRIYNFGLEIRKKQVPCRMCQEKGRTGKAPLNSDAQGGNEAGLAARATPPSAPQTAIPRASSLGGFLRLTAVDLTSHAQEERNCSRQLPTIINSTTKIGHKLQAKHSAPNSFPITDDASS